MEKLSYLEQCLINSLFFDSSISTREKFIRSIRGQELLRAFNSLSDGEKKRYIVDVFQLV